MDCCDWSQMEQEQPANGKREGEVREQGSGVRNRACQKGLSDP